MRSLSLKIIRDLFYTAFISLVFVSCQTNTDTKQDSAKNTQQPTAQADASQPQSPKTILFFGNSLTAGYGLDPSEAFPALIQKKIDSLNLPYKVINSGLSGETTAGGKSRISWVLREKVDVFVLELGGNDGLRGIDVESTRQNLQAIIDTVKVKNPDTRIVIAGMQIPPNMGPDYTARFRDIFSTLAQKNNTALIPFLLEGVGGIPALNLPDGIHPTAEGHKIVAGNVWNVLQPILTDNL